jgi:hypothetical protein
MSYRGAGSALPPVTDAALCCPPYHPHSARRKAYSVKGLSLLQILLGVVGIVFAFSFFVAARYGPGISETRRPPGGPFPTIPRELFKPYYPSPYTEKGWVYGSQCMALFGEDGGYFHGVCHYTASCNGNDSAEGWAAVEWRVDEYTPVSAVPCKVPEWHGGDDSFDPSKPRCLMPMKFKLKRNVTVTMITPLAANYQSPNGGLEVQLSSASNGGASCGSSNNHCVAIDLGTVGGAYAAAVFQSARSWSFARSLRDDRAGTDSTGESVITGMNTLGQVSVAGLEAAARECD